MLEYILRACVIYFNNNFDDHLPLIDFSYINSYNTSIGIALYEVLFEKGCFEVGDDLFVDIEYMQANDTTTQDPKSYAWAPPSLVKS